MSVAVVCGAPDGAGEAFAPPPPNRPPRKPLTWTLTVLPVCTSDDVAAAC